MLRDIKSNFAQFFSIFILSLISMWCFVGFQANVIGGKRARADFEKETNFSDGWIYGRSFDREQADKVKNLSKVHDVQLRTEVLGKAEEKYNSAEIWCYFEDEAEVTVPHTVSGSDYDPEDENGVWLFDCFADAWKLKVGDKFKVQVMGLDIEKEIKGFIETPEHIYSCASSDTDTDFHNIGYAYMSSKALPEEMRIFNEILFTCDGKALSLDKEISDALDKEYSFIGDRKSIDGYNRLVDELAQHDSFSYIFSAVFLAIALLVIITTMKRMVAQQRTQIGTLNALGMKRRKIMAHYVSYSLVISALGCTAGLILGLETFGKLMVDMFSEWYRVPGWKPAFNYRSPVLAAVIVLICSGASYLSCRQILKIHPSEALRPAAAKSAKSCIFEKLPFWDRLSFNTRYNLRDISRSKLRALMGIVGTALGMMLMTYGMGAYDTVDYVKKWYFEDIQNYDYQILLSDNCTKEQAEQLRDETDGELVSAAVISLAADPHPVSDDIISGKLTVCEGRDLFRVSDVDLNMAQLPKGKAAVTMKQARKLGLKQGDMIYWKTSDGDKWNEVEIGLISRHPSITGITLLRDDYEKAGFEFTPQMVVSKKDCKDASDRDYVSSVHSLDDLKKSFDKSMEVMNVLVYAMIAFSALLIIVVLYNSGNLSFNEREKEFATLKVMGFGSSKIRRLISSQNLWLSLIGVIIGIPFGRAPLQAMMDSNGDSIDWPAYISVPSYIIAGLFVMGVSILVGFMFSRRIKHIDMVEVLKGME